MLLYIEYTKIFNRNNEKSSVTPIKGENEPYG